MTRRVNSDVLENLFSYLKGMVDSNTHMTPIEFKYCNSLRWYLLGKHSNMVFTNNHNTQDTDESCLVNCLSGIIFNDAEVIECFPTDVQADITDNALTSVISDLGGNTKDTEESNLELLDNYDIHSLMEIHEMSEIEKECIEYITGSVVKKFISKYPYLGEKVYHCDDNNSSWTEKITKVNLIRPSSYVMYVANVIEIIFNLYHGNNGLNKSPGIIKKVTDLVIKEIKSQFPVEVINCLVRTRTFIRLNNLNKSIANKIFDVKKKKI
ncbi:Uncharacterized protein FWK35_00014165 [Aphis craccivora]|uniref:Transposable element P transposase-like C-terminal domain-containing protein n=1 Tax=Aphis craccivora TaxID=307492 RepID=A0A6G0Y4I0_APHCR|nr:Uncharacterized protein FWK35_00014165 [Aphis craccivora]